ncbi:aldehyde dehydrogenase family protein [Clostridium merdae]|uniref:aldehyde dehydrogenase family protein n=1 Tax=Clostridium merdae TaxID=1958780 RepID=UPI000A27200A|nr:aldehyde dehydrogenase family protein [Clostridium merdae]
MTLDDKLIEQVTRLVMEEMKSSTAEESESNSTCGNCGIFDSMDDAVKASEEAQRKYLFSSMEDRQKYVDTIRKTVLAPEMLEKLSRMAVEETGMGNYEHKLIKNRVAAEKSPGTEDLITEALTGDKGLTLVEYCPFGVIGAVTPATNPTETIICNSIAMLAGGNTVVFSPHPRAKNVTHVLVTALNQALQEVGAPANLIVTVREPSVENTNQMIQHPKVRVLVATGGPGIVKMVMSTGKKAIGAGAGNPPVVVDETADADKAAKDIMNGCSFDNNLPCIAEKEVIVVDSIADSLIWHMKNAGACEIKEESTINRLLQMVTNDKGGPKVEFVGKSAPYILNKLGINGCENVRVIIMETKKDHPFVMEELMMPILPIVRAADVDEAIEIALVAERGNRHTAIMHSKNVDKLTKMAKLLQTTIFVKNAPSYAGIGVGGEGCTTFTIAGPTGEGLTTARSFCRKRRCVMSDALHIR